MKSQEIEVIVSRHFAESLTSPVFLVDKDGNLLFYNEAAEELLGKRYQDTGPMPVVEWSVLFQPEDMNGNRISPENLPLVKTLATRKPNFGSFYIKSIKGDRHFINVTGIPLFGHANQFVGAIAIFWKND